MAYYTTNKVSPVFHPCMQLRTETGSDNRTSDGRSWQINGQKSDLNLMKQVLDILDRQGVPDTDSEGEHDQKTIMKFEKLVWMKLGCKGPLIPEALLKECQKVLIKVMSGRDGDRDNLALLEKWTQVLDRVHHRRKEAALAFRSPSLPPKFLQLHHPVKNDNKDGKRLLPSPDNTNTIPGSRFWALIIGNNDYARKELGGCIRDAVLVQEYCKQCLHIPPDNITLMKDANRDEMIDALYGLRDNQRIQPGDVVLIYYSGHGTSYDPDVYQFPGPVAKIPGSIEALCPVDRSKSIPDISDRELNNILNEVYRERKAKIAVILDCCYSGGAVRAPAAFEDGGTIRYISPLTSRIDEQLSNLQAMLCAADTHPRRRQYSPVTNDSSWVGNVDNLVLMAACQDFQITIEAPFEVPADLALSSGAVRAGELPPLQRYTRPKKLCGRFTQALLEALSSKSEAVLFGTFEDLITYIGKIDETQVPVALGGYRTSRIWFAGET